MKYAFLGFLCLALSIFFYEKKWERLKVVAYCAAIVFLAIGAISVWVGDYLLLVFH